MKRCPVRPNDLAKMPGYRRDSDGQPVSGEPEQLCSNACLCVGSLRRIVTTERAGATQAIALPRLYSEDRTNLILVRLR